MQSVRIRVPATTANLGPGFDTFGCALARDNTVTFTRLPEGQLAFENVLPEFCQEDNLAVRSFRHAEMALGLAPTGLRVRIDADIPVSSGLGSSATMIVAGVTAAFLLGNHPYDLWEILRLATQLEGHPDNVAPAIYGGLTVSTMTEDGPLSVPFPVHDSVRFLVLLPDYRLSTQVSRSVLPTSLSYADAVFNISHAAILTRALAEGDASMIRLALRDRLHEPYRSPLIHDFEALREAALRAGCCGFCLSGAGPTCLAMTCEADSENRLAELLPSVSPHYTVCAMAVDRTGLHYEASDSSD